MVVRIKNRRDNKTKQNRTKQNKKQIYKGLEVVRSYDHPSPDAIRYIQDRIDYYYRLRFTFYLGNFFYFSTKNDVLIMQKDLLSYFK